MTRTAPLLATTLGPSLLGATLLGATLLGASLLGASAAPAAAGDAPFEAFAAACADTHADYPAIVAAAQAGGWTPAEVTAPTMDKVKVSETLSRGKKADGVALTLFAWQGATKDGVQVTGCTVRASKADVASAQAAAQAWLGFAPQSPGAAKATFRFTEADGARTAIDSTRFDAAAAGGGLEMLTVSGDAKGTVIDLLKIKK